MDPSLNGIATDASPEDLANSQRTMASPQKPTEFHSYPKLPAELKLMIWACHFKKWESGAHRFRLTIDPIQRDRLALTPDKDQKDDASAWRERNATARVDKYSFDAFRMKLERLPSVHSLYQFPPAKRRGLKNYGRDALVNSETDLVTFRFNYGTTRGGLNYLNLGANRDVFAGITRVGVEHEYFWRGWARDRTYKPLQCICQNPPSDHCPRCMIRFLRYFKDLETLYLICPIKPSTFSEIAAIIYQAIPKTSRRLVKKGKREVSLDIFRYLEEKQNPEGNQDPEETPEKTFDVFHDRMGTYLEVTYEDSHKLIYQPIWSYLDRLSQEWNKQLSLIPEMRPIEFKALVYIDLRNVRVEGDQELLRTSGPWR
ncbi:hypothetical protein F4678DRAFT_467155 [Xylaria arbuscula]|nr:hypothetical protein F4678DRAFT_467155 [Xylaria arbuscula]